MPVPDPPLAVQPIVLRTCPGMVWPSATPFASKSPFTIATSAAFAPLAAPAAAIAANMANTLLFIRISPETTRPVDERVPRLALIACQPWRSPHAANRDLARRARAAATNG